MVRRPPRPTRPELRRPPQEPSAHRVVVPEDDDARPVLRPRGHVSEFLPLADVLPAARARRADEPLVRASGGMRWEEPAGAQLSGLEVERPTEVAPAPAAMATAARPAEVVAGPVAVAGAAWGAAAPAEQRVSTHRQLALLAAAVGMFLLSVLVVAVVLLTGERSPEPAVDPAGREAGGGAPLAVEPAAAPSVEAPRGAAPAAPGERPAGGEGAPPRPAIAEAPRRDDPPSVDRDAPPASPKVEREPPRADEAPPPKPKPEPKAPKVTAGMRAVGFRFNGDWGGGTAQVSCGARFHVEKSLSGSGARMEIKPETCEATVRCAEGGGRTSLSVRASATEVVCAGCTADAPQPVCSVR
jgi:hypothetical protein